MTHMYFSARAEGRAYRTAISAAQILVIHTHLPAAAFTWFHISSFTKKPIAIMLKWHIPNWRDFWWLK